MMCFGVYAQITKLIMFLLGIHYGKDLEKFQRNKNVNLKLITELKCIW